LDRRPQWSQKQTTAVVATHRRPQLSPAAVSRPFQAASPSPTARVMSARCYAIERAFLDKPVQGSELCLALYKGTAAPLPLCLKEIPSASSAHFRAVLCAASCNLHKRESCCSLSKGDSFSAAVRSVLLLQLAQRGALLLQVLISGHDGPVLLLLLLGVCCSLCCS